MVVVMTEKTPEAFSSCLERKVWLNSTTRAAQLLIWRRVVVFSIARVDDHNPF